MGAGTADSRAYDLQGHPPTPPLWNLCSISSMHHRPHRRRRAGPAPTQSRPILGSTVLPEPALEGPDAGEGNVIEPSEIFVVDAPAERSGILLGLMAVLGAGDRDGALRDHPVQRDLAGRLPIVLVADAAQFVDDEIDDDHWMRREGALSGWGVRHRVLAGEAALADRRERERHDPEFFAGLKQTVDLR